MGFSPQQVDEMSLWQFAACVDGFNRSRGVDDPIEPPTEAEFYDMVERLG